MECLDRRGGCCIARNGEAVKLGRIMLRYRPIAPKPASTLSARPDAAVSSVRTKRGSAVGSGKRGRKARRVMVTPVVTLPLMPETPERSDTVHGAPSPTSSTSEMQSPRGGLVAPKAVRAAGAWVTVDRVTDISGEEVGSEMEGCPGFISDDGDRVIQTNDEFKKMVVGEEEGEVRVALVTRGLVPKEARAFTCRVTVRYVCRRRGKVMLAAPCDAWRLDGGGLAWRVDVKAALSLSLG